jgi:CHAD domain-containing protein
MRPRAVKRLDPEAPLRSNATRILATRLDEFLSLMDQALDPAAAGAQHDLRIAAKRLRYVLELTSGCFGPPALRARVAAKELQGILGDLHDCDVMMARASGVASLGGLLRARRESLFARFFEQLRSEAEKGTWRSLARAL